MLPKELDRKCADYIILFIWTRCQSGHISGNHGEFAKYLNYLDYLQTPGSGLVEVKSLSPSPKIFGSVVEYE